MRLTKLETKLENFFNGSYFHSAAAPAVPVRLPYQILVTCRSQGASQIEQLILSQLQDACQQAYHLQMMTRELVPLVDLTLSMTCSTAERATLVRLVSRLGLEKDVRSVCWQSVPQGGR